MLREVNGTIQQYTERVLTTGIKIYCKTSEEKLLNKSGKAPVKIKSAISASSDTLTTMSLFGEV